MTELVVALLVLGAALVVFSPVLAGRDTPGGRATGQPVRKGRDDEPTALRERKHRLLRSLKELEAERAAGRVSESDYAALKARDQGEAARVIQQLEQVEAGFKAGHRPLVTTPAGPLPGRQKAARVAAWVGGIALFGGVLVFTMSRAITPRAPGGTITGTIPGGEGRPAPSSPLLPAADPARLAQLERTIRGDSSNLAALLEAGHLLLAEQRLDEAARVTMRALQVNREAPEAYAHIAVLLFAESSSHEQADSARTALEASLDAINYALKLKPDMAEAWLFKGMISMAGLRDPNAAADAWEQYLKVAPPGADTTRIAAMVRAARSR